jgi:hypothetical protein
MNTRPEFLAIAFSRGFKLYIPSACGFFQGSSLTSTSFFVAKQAYRTNGENIWQQR